MHLEDKVRPWNAQLPIREENRLELTRAGQDGKVGMGCWSLDQQPTIVTRAIYQAKGSTLAGLVHTL